MNGEWVNKVVDTLVQFGTTYGMKVVGAIIILLVGRIVAGLIRGVARGAMHRARSEPSLIGFVGSLVYYGVLAFAAIAALNTLGVQTTSAIAVLGAAGLAVGLALQGSLANFAAGVLIMIFRPFHVGNFITAAGQSGTVQEIGIFTTTLHSPDNQKIILPNAAVTGGVIVNVTANDTRRVDLKVGISYADDIGKAKEALTNAVMQNPKVLQDPAPTVEVVELGDSSVNFVVRPWVKTTDYWEAYFALTRAIKEALDDAGVSIPFPQRDVHLFQKTV